VPLENSLVCVERDLEVAVDFGWGEIWRGARERRDLNGNFIRGRRGIRIRRRTAEANARRKVRMNITRKGWSLAMAGRMGFDLRNNLFSEENWFCESEMMS
jgi:hypothetical protein